jgi:phosphate/phosphite/phosphonate ABC transporter binding protein
MVRQIADGSSTYGGYIVVSRESGINSIEELRGKTIAFIDRTSASGYIYPLALFKSMGIDPELFFSKVAFLGNHLIALDAVLNRKIDAATIYSGALKAAKGKGMNIDGLKIIAKTERIPWDAFAANSNVPQQLVDRLTTALLALDSQTDKGKIILGGLLGINGFVHAEDKDYDGVRHIMSVVGEDEAYQLYNRLQDPRHLMKVF